MRFFRTAVIAALGIAAAAVAPVQVAMASTVGSGGHSASTQASSALPYTDPNQAGWLTLCGMKLQPVTSGSIHTQPFVWRVVSDLPAPKGYFVAGAKAQLFAYQPRPGTLSSDWSGTVMAAGSFYSNPAHPMAQMTPIDSPLTQMTAAFPPMWDHLIELRLYLGAPGLTEYTTKYAAADIQVIGDTWTLVAGGHSSCTSGKVVPVEQAIGMPGSSGTPKPGQSGATGGGSSSASGTGTGTGAAAVTTSAPGSVPAAVEIGSGVVIIAVLASGVIWLRRRRIATTDSSVTPE